MPLSYPSIKVDNSNFIQYTFPNLNPLQDDFIQPQSQIGLKMAKKRKNRHLNIARKRAKRQQNQKFKRKQLAIQKQRALQTAKSDEELLQDKIVSSGLLLGEPEFENITLDQDLLREKTTEAFEAGAFTSKTEGGEEATPEGEEGPESISDTFRFEVLRHLITVEFINSVSYALKACETRLKRMGSREKAEIAFVARSLFEYADPETLAFHPLIFNICAFTFKQMLADPQSEPDAVTTVLSDVFEESQWAEVEDQPETPRDLDEDEEAVDLASEPVLILKSEEDHATKPETTSPAPKVLPETLKAKALYQNGDGLDIRNTIEFGNGYRVVQTTDSQVEFAHTDGQRYITLTANRLLLQCPSIELLDVAMAEVETLCNDALFYLARTVDDT
ncbi:hypothetical protein F4X33_15870 [Candidatus Poribacteria bacterium]|nr:hypothetical protein [Candidatus Poribacteria bacterium]